MSHARRHRARPRRRHGSLAVATLVVAALSALALGAACGPRSAAERGEALFQDPGFSRSASNAFACATCHSTRPAGADPRRDPGYTLHDVVGRPSYWGGAYLTLLEAVNYCVVEFMRGRPLPANDDDGRALYAYLASISPRATSPALPLTVVKDIVDVPNGDPARGAALYADSCGGCHGAVHTGVGRIGSYVSRIPDESLAQHGTDPKTGARPITIEKIRHGKFFSIGGNMPFYSVEALDDAAVGDLLVHLGL